MVDRIIDPNLAARAYSNMSSMPVSASMPTKDVPTLDNKGVSFGEYMKDSVAESIQVMKHGETMQARAVTGQADITEVVQAVTNAELTLQTIVAVRDRMISAYKEIMSMPI